MLLEWQTFSIWQDTGTTWDGIVSPQLQHLAWNSAPKSLLPFCRGSPYFNMQQCPLSRVSARQKFLPEAVFGGIITWLGKALLFLCCPRQRGESEALCSASHASLKRKSNLRVKITLEREKRVGNIHSKHASCLSTAVDATVASTSLGHFLPTSNAKAANVDDCCCVKHRQCVWLIRPCFPASSTTCTCTKFTAIRLLAPSGFGHGAAHLLTHVSEARIWSLKCQREGRQNK